VGPTLRGFRVSGFRDFKSQTSTHNNSRILKVKRKWDQHFGVSGFGISRLQKPNINTQQLPNLKMKRSGTNTSGFRGSGFRDFKSQTSTHNNSRIPKVKRKWDQHFGISGFRISRLGTSCFHFVCATLLKQGSLNMNSRSCTALGKGKILK
jgi:hypothetical protein